VVCVNKAVLQKLSKDKLHLKLLVVFAKVDIVDLGPELFELLFDFLLQLVDAIECCLPGLIS